MENRQPYHKEGAAETNIFLNAAMTGHVVYPQLNATENADKTSLTVASMSTQLCPKIIGSKSPDSKSTSKRSGHGRISFSDAEDILVVKAFDLHHKDYRAIVKFMVRHKEILPKGAMTYYAAIGDSKKREKAAEERIRKRVASTLLKTPSSVDDAPSTSVIDEYVSNDNSDTTDQEESYTQDNAASQESARRKRYVPSGELSKPSDVLSSLKKASDAERGDISLHRSEPLPKRKKGKFPSAVAETLPYVLKAVQQAAESHTEAMKKWSMKILGIKLRQ